MQEPNTPPPTNGAPPNDYGNVYGGVTGQPSAYPPPNYPPPGYVAEPGSYGQLAHPPAQGLSDAAAGTVAYLTIIPAIIFLVLAPYNTRPFVRFHAVQCLGLAVAGFCLHLVGLIPFLGLLIVILGDLALLVVWILCLVKASQGSYLKLPVISDFAAQQSGFPLR